MAANRRRGLLRLLVVILGLWCLVIGGLYAREDQNASAWDTLADNWGKAYEEATTGPTPNDAVARSALGAGMTARGEAEKAWRRREFYGTLGLGLPLAVGVLAVLGLWVARGFQTVPDR
jgi:hypothetical protein